MRNGNARKNARILADMKLRSVSLPGYSAEVLDISAGGARVKLRSRAGNSLLEDRIRFGVSLSRQMNVQFEGFARVVWVRETPRGIEAGLQWEKLTEAAWQRAEQALVF